MNNEFWQQLWRYGIVGGIAFVLDYGCLFVLTEYCGIHYLYSAAIAFLVGLATNYILSKIWVFKDNRIGNKFIEFLLFAVIGVVGLGLNELLIYIFAHCLSFHYMVGKIVSTIVVFFWNFLARKYLLFHSK